MHMTDSRDILRGCFWYFCATVQREIGTHPHTSAVPQVPL